MCWFLLVVRFSSLFFLIQKNLEKSVVDQRYFYERKKMNASGIGTHIYMQKCFIFVQPRSTAISWIIRYCSDNKSSYRKSRKANIYNRLFFFKWEKRKCEYNNNIDIDFSTFTKYTIIIMLNSFYRRYMFLLLSYIYHSIWFFTSSVDQEFRFHISSETNVIIQVR